MCTLMKQFVFHHVGLNLGLMMSGLVEVVQFLQDLWISWHL